MSVSGMDSLTGARRLCGSWTVAFILVREEHHPLLMVFTTTLVRTCKPVMHCRGLQLRSMTETRTVGRLRANVPGWPASSPIGKPVPIIFSPFLGRGDKLPRLFVVLSWMHHAIMARV